MTSNIRRRLLTMTGFDKELALKDHGQCPFCQKIVNPESFRDDLSRKEFEISGLCQGCQDEMFG